MKKILMVTAVLLIVFAGKAAAVTGFWQTIDDETGKPKSVVAVYEYEGKVYGRVLLTYQPDGATVKDTLYTQSTIAENVPGKPPFCGLDIIWNLAKEKDGKYKNGKIMDPQKGSIYDCVVWQEKNGDLNVRGKILFVGRTQTWKPFDAKNFPDGFKTPDITKFTPVISVKK